MTDPSPAPGLRRELGFPQVTASGVGIIIGAGIYVLLGPATAEAGGLVWLAFLVSAVLCGLTGLSYAELSSMYPGAGAEYEYTRQVAPEPTAFVVGWTMVAGLVVASATIALGFAQYLQHFLDIPLRLGAWALLAVVAAIATTGIKRATWLVLGLGAVQVGGLVVVIAVGTGHLGEVDLLAGRGAGGVVGAAALVFFAFIGFDEVITLSDETRDPSRTVPRALLAALGISAGLYALVSVTAVSVLGPDELGRSTRPLADVVRHVLGETGVSAMSVAALLTTTNTTLLAITAASRLLYGMADHGSLPTALLRTNRRAAPTATIVAAAIAAAGLVAIGDLTIVAGAADFTVYVVFLAVNAAVIVLRVRRPEQERTFRVPLSIGRLPIVPVLGIVATLAMMPNLDLTSIAVGSGIVVLGALVGAIPGRRTVRTAPPPSPR